MATPTAAFSISLRVRLDNRPGTLGRLATAIGEVGGNITAIGGFDVRSSHLDEDLVVNCSSEEHIEKVTAAVHALDGVDIVDVSDRTFAMHAGGKIEVLARMPIADRDDLSMAYTPGVARVCTAIQHQPALVHELTIKKNTVAIVTDGTAVLGLGDIGPAGA
ncbi:MAG: ACT domain-containing protein, partial [Acidimicrobiales bacterium]